MSEMFVLLVIALNYFQVTNIPIHHLRHLASKQPSIRAANIYAHLKNEDRQLCNWEHWTSVFNVRKPTLCPSWYWIRKCTTNPQRHNPNPTLNSLDRVLKRLQKANEHSHYFRSMDRRTDFLSPRQKSGITMDQKNESLLRKVLINITNICACTGWKIQIFLLNSQWKMLFVFHQFAARN
jgi:hypothetical protein